MVVPAQEIPSTTPMANAEAIQAQADTRGPWIHRRVNRAFPLLSSLPAHSPAASARSLRALSGGFR